MDQFAGVLSAVCRFGCIFLFLRGWRGGGTEGVVPLLIRTVQV